LPQVGLPLGPGESVVPTVKVQDFHYSPFALAAMAGVIAGLMLLVFWFRTRPRRVKA
jgi:presenilin-like A22 family membrane protease